MNSLGTFNLLITWSKRELYIIVRIINNLTKVVSYELSRAARNICTYNFVTRAYLCLIYIRPKISIVIFRR